MGFTKRLVETFMQQSRSATSGYQDDDDINRNLHSIDNELMETFAPLYSENGKVQDILQPFVTEVKNQTITSGVLAKPENYVQYIDSIYKGSPVMPRNINEVSIIKSSPIRRPTLEKGPYFVYFSSGNINYLPESLSSVDLFYLRKPKPGSIVYSAVSTEDSDYVELSVVDEIEWPDRVFNLFLYHLLEKYGVEMKDQLMIEYSQLGITREISKT